MSALERGNQFPAATLSIVVPCYNEAPGLRELTRRLTSLQVDGYVLEIVLVDDGSADETWPILNEAADADERIALIRLARNHGHQIALSAGLRICSGERILIIDADLQDPPELVHDMLKVMDQGYHVVYGRRIERAGDTLFKRVSAFAFYRVLRRIVSIDIPMDAGDFRLMSRRALDVLNAMPERHRFIRGMVSWIGFSQIAFDYKRQERYAGKTKYPLRKMIKFALDAITGFSIAPLRLATYLAFLTSLAAVVLTIRSLMVWSSGTTIPGWTSLMIVTLILGAAGLAILGILGEYVGRMYIEQKQRPMYVIEEIRGARRTPTP